MKLNEVNVIWFVFIGEVAILIALAVIYFNRTTESEDSDSSPVEEIVKIDSISKENSKLVIEVNNLGSIKDAKTIEVKSLDNDSTLKLFYQLISK